MDAAIEGIAAVLKGFLAALAHHHPDLLLPLLSPTHPRASQCLALRA
jgi:hypothetical protein